MKSVNNKSERQFQKKVRSSVNFLPCKHSISRHSLKFIHISTVRNFSCITSVLLFCFVFSLEKMFHDERQFSKLTEFWIDSLIISTLSPPMSKCVCGVDGNWSSVKFDRVWSLSVCSEPLWLLCWIFSEFIRAPLNFEFWITAKYIFTFVDIFVLFASFYFQNTLTADNLIGMRYYWCCCSV